MGFHSLELRSLGARRLRYAVAASLLLHLLILWPANSRLPTQERPAQLQASLRQLPRPMPTSVPLQPPPRAIAPALSVENSAFGFAKGNTLAPPAFKPGQKPLERPKPASVPQTLAAPAVADQMSAPGTAFSAVPPNAPRLAPAAESSGALLTEANASGEAVDGLRGYRLAVATQARRYKRYPAQAMASGWAGSAEIRVEVGKEGLPRAATVVRSSGHDTLDSAALAMIDAGVMRARLPDSLRGKAFAIALPVVFNLEEE